MRDSGVRQPLTGKVKTTVVVDFIHPLSSSVVPRYLVKRYANVSVTVILDCQPPTSGIN